MTIPSSAFGVYFRDNLGSRIDELVDSIHFSQKTVTVDYVEHTLVVDTAERRVGIKRVLLVIAEGIINDDLASIAAFARQIGEERARQRISVTDMLAVFERMRDYVWEHLNRYLENNEPWTPQDTRAIEDILHVYQRSYFGGFSVVYQNMQNDLLEQAAALEEQRRLVQELSTPIVPIYQGVLLLPLVGSIDEHRAARITESVLNEITRSRAEIILVDITGVPVIDAYVANHLVSLTRAVGLLGAQVVLVGIRAEIAHTIIQLGIDIRGITTYANLQAGMVYALQRQGLRL